jgi:hypothetical protein
MGDWGAASTIQTIIVMEPTGSTRRDIEERKMDGGQAGREQIRLP